MNKIRDVYKLLTFFVIQFFKIKITCTHIKVRIKVIFGKQILLISYEKKIYIHIRIIAWLIRHSCPKNIRVECYDFDE